jgi:hypothetical protein
VPACRNAALSWAASVEFVLDEIHIDVDARRKTVNHSAHSFAMAFAE